MLLRQLRLCSGEMEAGAMRPLYPTIVSRLIVLRLLNTFNVSHHTSNIAACTMANTDKKSVLIIGGGAVGAVAALNLQVGGLADVTIVLRSNFDAVKDAGYDFESCDHGSVTGFKPSVGMFPFGWIDIATLLYLTNANSSAQHHPRHHSRGPRAIRLHPAFHQKHTRRPSYSR